MSEYGLAVNLNGGLPDATEVAALGLSNGWLRSPLQGPLSLLDNAVLLPPTVKLCVMLDNQCGAVGGDWSGWETALRTIVTRYRSVVRAVECGNELDSFLDTPPEFAANLIRRAVPILRPAGILTIASSVTSGDWQGYLPRMIALCGDRKPDFCAFHGYGQGFPDVPQSPKFGNLFDAVHRAHELTGLPVALTEGGVKIGEVGGPAGQAAYVSHWLGLLRQMSASIVPFGCYFAWSDLIGAPSERGDAAFGLRDVNMKRRPAWSAFAEGTAGAVPAPPPPPIPTPPVPAPVVAGPGGSWIGNGLLASLNKLGLTPATGELNGEGGTSVVYCAGGMRLRWLPWESKAYLERSEAA